GAGGGWREGGGKCWREALCFCFQSLSFWIRNCLTFSSNAPCRSTTCRKICWTTGGVSAQSSGVISMLDRVRGSDSISLRLPNQALFFMDISLPREYRGGRGGGSP